MPAKKTRNPILREAYVAVDHEGHEIALGVHSAPRYAKAALAQLVGAHYADLFTLSTRSSAEKEE